MVGVLEDTAILGCCSRCHIFGAHGEAAVIRVRVAVEQRLCAFTLHACLRMLGRSLKTQSGTVLRLASSAYLPKVCCLDLQLDEHEYFLAASSAYS